MLCIKEFLISIKVAEVAEVEVVVAVTIMVVAMTTDEEAIIAGDSIRTEEAEEDMMIGGEAVAAWEAEEAWVGAATGVAGPGTIAERRVIQSSGSRRQVCGQNNTCSTASGWLRG